MYLPLKTHLAISDDRPKFTQLGTHGRFRRRRVFVVQDRVAIPGQAIRNVQFNPGSALAGLIGPLVLHLDHELIDGHRCWVTFT